MKLTILSPSHLALFKKDMQDAFQQGAIDGMGSFEGQVLPQSDIDKSLSAKGAIAYGAFEGNQLVGGAIVIIDKQSQHNHLDFLYVKNGFQGKGLGLAIWQEIEKLHPQTKVWETCTPYFEKRNIHFYVNKCGFAIVEFFNDRHCDPNDTDADNDNMCGMFRLVKTE